ncbi:hypothetical protein FRC12_018842 [Ceratobasidium sp. 428]|nr:hypothetical protein FRC12_018842 [Ceratobasidium sp. 428]
MDTDKYRAVLRGKEKPSDTGAKSTGMNKITAQTEIAREVIPAVWAKDALDAGRKVGNQIIALKKLHRTLHAELYKTGSGLGGDQENEALTEVELEHYVGANGPDGNTAKHISNLWEEITRENPLWPALHKLFGTHPTQVAVATTTGVGPEGPLTTLHQKPSSPPLPSSPWIFPSIAHLGPNPDSDSDCEILEPARSPSPEVEGNGKRVDPRERGGKVVKPKQVGAKVKEESKVKETAAMEGKAKVKEEVKVKAKVKEDVKVKEEAKAKVVKTTQKELEKVEPKEKKICAPRSIPPTNFADTSGSSTGSSGGGKKRKREDGMLSSLHELMAQQYNNSNAREDVLRSDAQFQAEMDRHDKSRGTMSMESFYKRENEIRAAYGRKPLTLPESKDSRQLETPVRSAHTQAKAPRAQPKVTPKAHPRPQAPTQPQTPPRRTAAEVIVIESSSPPVIDIKTSSPVKREPASSPVKYEPASSPIKKEASSSSVKQEEMDELLDEQEERKEYNALMNANLGAPVCAPPPFGFQP